MLASTKLSDSGDTEERTWAEGVLGLDLTLTFKYDTTGSGWSPVEGYEPGVYAHSLLGAPEYFLIKTGNVTDGDVKRNWLFRNLDESSFAVIDLEAMGFKRISNVGGISHITQFDGSTKVPEPGTLILLGSGLIGLAAWGRKTIRM